jgi:hypothetical protein
MPRRKTLRETGRDRERERGESIHVERREKREGERRNKRGRTEDADQSKFAGRMPRGTGPRTGRVHFL